jgi:cation:H+ antiporter
MQAILLIVAGLVVLVVGAEVLVRGASRLALAAGVSPLVIGLTVVAYGTSAPEFAVNVRAALEGQPDIAVGNVVGSNIFNILSVLGIAGVISGNVVVAPAALHFDIPVMVGVAVACLPIFFTGARISRWEGALFAAYYVAYVVYLVLTARQHASVDAFGAAMLWYALPATALGLVVSAAYALRPAGTAGSGPAEGRE